MTEGITDHDDVDLSHQGVPRDEDYPLKRQMPTMIPLGEDERIIYVHKDMGPGFTHHSSPECGCGPKALVEMVREMEADGLLDEDDE